MSDTFWHGLLWLGVALPAVLLLAIGLMPSSVANRSVRGLRAWVSRIAGTQFLIAATVALVWMFEGGEAIHAVLFEPSESTPLGLSVHFDGVSSLMLVLVSFVGWNIARYSIRYMDGEPGQGRYFRWTAFTIGAVSVMVISGNLFMFVVAWVMTSLGLHQLLLQYPDRTEARRAAWTKFTISRIGDIALVSAMILVLRTFGTLEFDQLFTMAEDARLSGASIGADGGDGGWATVCIGWLIMFGAVTKSAQVPFHSWLPLTMETPTPVSALMHAGIVNAGGYLIVRMSPLVAMAPAALATLAIIGAVTACFAAVVMLTQTSIKRSLAYSTIAQMGFMMLQCGLGAFSAAMLHILAHSLYKAYAFLSSGSVIAERTATDVSGERAAGQGGVAISGATGWLAVGGSFLVTLAFYFGVMTVAGIRPSEKPGGYVLGFTLCLALAYWLSASLASRRVWVVARSVLVTGVLVAAYAVGYLAIDRLVGSRVASIDPDWTMWLIAGIVAAGFGSLFVLHQWLLAKADTEDDGSTRPQWIDAMYVHASNGFYVDSVVRRVMGALTHS